MNLQNKKELAARTLGVGKHRIKFNQEGLEEIKEAITKQDIKSLVEEGIITINNVKGRRTQVKKKTRRGPGKVKKKINRRKQIYVKITRKLRRHVKELQNKGHITRDEYIDLRKKIRMSHFRSKAHLKEHVSNVAQLKAKENQDEGEGKVKKTKKVSKEKKRQ